MWIKFCSVISRDDHQRGMGGEEGGRGERLDGFKIKRSKLRALFLSASSTGNLKIMCLNIHELIKLYYLA